MFSIISPQPWSLPEWVGAERSNDAISTFVTLPVSGAWFFHHHPASSKRHVSEFLREEHAFLSRCMDAMSNICEEHAIEYSCSGRVKTFASTCQKMQCRGVGYGDIIDVIGVRLVVRDVKECYRVLFQILLLYPYRMHSIRDYIAHPKSNGYQSLHVSIRSHEQRRLEVQIRTAAMHADCLRGRAAHSRYKARPAQSAGECSMRYRTPSENGFNGTV